ncbi:ornithine cyclodeaminase family protein [Jannaschia seohaensis]|uniref:Ornithine cyclodeaminase n=1 Tax=Jannaschia seohaensis TaxID=475081 RepID=A0A2Y9ASW0_9RHOB|nr:ornithine cyclodeaminase [Jannaschia seohaensis]PWJ17448.1 ornithine cyclodeaminase [Jannaschia seohaensis]SSA47511.1 ornithine cyclodeaminase [Jannaschia seohaensis]
MTAPHIGPEAERALDWIALTDALAAGHTLPRATVGDTFLYRRDDTMLSRAAWIDGLGALVKTAMIFPGNVAAGKPAVGGGVSIFSDQDGTLAATMDFRLLTKWKTAGDSLLGARRLARPDSRRILLVGSGTVALSLRQAYAAAFPEASFTVWSRNPDNARAFAEAHDASPAPDLEAAVAEADIVACATMTTEPVLCGAWLRPGQHVDLIGAYRPDMREVDDDALRRARIFVDSRETTLDHIGELKIPLAEGVIDRDAVLADYYDGDAMRRGSDAEITMFKNGGGAHLDLMTARYIMDAVG